MCWGNVSTAPPWGRHKGGQPVGSILILFGLAGLAAGLLGLASLAKGSLRLVRIGSRNPASVAGSPLVACLPRRAWTWPPPKALSAKATLPAPPGPPPAADSAPPAP